MLSYTDAPKVERSWAYQHEVVRSAPARSIVQGGTKSYEVVRSCTKWYEVVRSGAKWARFLTLEQPSASIDANAKCYDSSAKYPLQQNFQKI